MDKDDPDHPARHPRRRVGHPAVAGVAAEPSEAVARAHRSQTMLQQTALRLQGFAHARLAALPLLVTNEDYRFIVADQLTQVGVTELPHRVGAGGQEHRRPALTVRPPLAPRRAPTRSDPIHPSW